MFKIESKCENKCENKSENKSENYCELVYEYGLILDKVVVPKFWSCVEDLDYVGHDGDYEALIPTMKEYSDTEIDIFRLLLNLYAEKLEMKYINKNDIQMSEERWLNALYLAVSLGKNEYNEILEDESVLEDFLNEYNEIDYHESFSYVFEYE